MNFLPNRRRARVTDAALLERLRDSDLGQQIAKEIETGDLTARKRWAKDLAAVDAELLARLPAVDEAVIKADADLAAAYRELEAARTAYRAAHGHAEGARRTADYQRGVIEAKLRETSSPAIADLSDWLHICFEVVRHTPIVFESPTGNRPLSDAATKRNVKAAELRSSALAAIQSARTEAEALKLAALSDADLEAKLTTITGAVAAELAASGVTVPPAPVEVSR